LLHNDEELQAAVERARAFERRDDYRQRRAGVYDHFLSPEAVVAPITPIDKRGVAIVQMVPPLRKATIVEGLEDEVNVK
jgi:hypothetical protein